MQVSKEKSIYTFYIHILIVLQHNYKTLPGALLWTRDLGLELT